MGNPTPAYLLKRDQEIRDIKNAADEAERKRKESIKSVEPIVSDKSTTQPK
jgi:hypothetical protein